MIGFFGVAFQFVRGVMLARWLGVAEYGHYSFVLAMVTFLLVPVQGGQVTLVTRATAAYLARLDVALLRGFWLRQMQWGITYGIIVACMVVIVASVGGLGFLPEGTLGPLFYAIPLFLVLPIARVVAAALNGMQRTTEGQIPEKIIQPFMFICLLVASTIGMSNRAIGAAQAFIFLTISAFMGGGVGFYWLRRYQPTDLNRVAPAYEIKAWIRSLMPLTLMGVVAAINSQADALMLGFLRNAVEVGIYRVASNVSGLVAFALFTINVVVGPRIADLYSQGKSKELQETLTMSARVILVGALVVGLPFILLGDKIVVHVFGIQYATSYEPLVILCIGQFINASAGSVGCILNMTGNEREALVGMCAGACVNVMMNLFLIPPYGSSGAAIATASSLVVWNVLLLYFVHKRVSLHSTALGRL